jgi:hypothetical protein
MNETSSSVQMHQREINVHRIAEFGANRRI